MTDIPPATEAEMLAYENICTPDRQMMSRALTIHLKSIEDLLGLANTLAAGTSQASKDFREWVGDLPSMAQGEAKAFRLQRELLLQLKRIYEEETGQSVDDWPLFKLPEDLWRERAARVRQRSSAEFDHPERLTLFGIINVDKVFWKSALKWALIFAIPAILILGSAAYRAQQ